MKSETLNNNEFSINLEYFDNTRETQIEMLINGNNILSFIRGENLLTTRWNLDELALWMRNFVDNMRDDPFPVEADGEYAAEKDVNAREFDTDDEDEFDEYYDRLDAWNLRHRWHTASEGAILADVYFQLVGNYVEISWNNKDAEEDVIFQNEFGGTKIDKDKFIEVVNTFLNDYAEHWF